MHEFRNTGKAQASSHGGVAYPSHHLGASSSNIAASALNNTGGVGASSSIKPKKSQSIDKKGTMSSSQVQQQLQIVASLSSGSGQGDSKKLPAKKGKTKIYLKG